MTTIRSDIGQYGIVPRWLLAAPVSDYAIRLFAWMAAAHADRNDDTCFPSHQSLAENTGRSVSSVRRALKELRAAGAVSVELQQRDDGGRTANLCRLVYASPVSRPPFTSEQGALSTSEQGLKGLKPESEVTNLAVKQIFDYWVQKSGRDPARTLLTEKRKTKIRARLKDGYTVERIQRAIDGCLASDFHVRNGHTDIELICREGTNLEGFEIKAGVGNGSDPRYLLEAIREARNLMPTGDRDLAIDAGAYPYDARSESVVRGA